ncbi:MAG: PqqD family protein [Eubacterium sp.]|nr:PqqD family protein [Eubacterium sp.]
MKIKKTFVKRKIGDKYLVVSTDKKNSGSFFIEMNETSGYIWDLIEKGLSKDEIAKALSEQYGIDYEKALTDTEKLIQSMSKADIFEEG